MSAWGVLISPYTGASLVELVTVVNDDDGVYMICRPMGSHKTFVADYDEVERFATREEAEKRFASLHSLEMSARSYL